ncbi:MAG: hypothetical protein LBG48_03090, partial [Rickettsiales bacterium]|nr:hypothetical protein [Rickettsiales bacterium]
MPNLTPGEIQEIHRYLAEDKPLPDRYRFLLFEDKREVELVWHGKSKTICDAVMPFEVIERVDEPRLEQPEAPTLLTLKGDRGGKRWDGWRDKLIWGDNKFVMSSLKDGPWREEIDRQGGIKLIYIDPPFDVGTDYSMDIEIGDGNLTKKSETLGEIAYRDTWGSGT